MEAPIHVYYHILWEHKFKIHYTNICEKFIAPMYKIIFCKLARCMTEKAMQAIGEVGDWYVTNW
jgi:hypothetical protein